MVEKNRTVRYQTVFVFWSSTKRNPTLRVLVGRLCLPTATFGPCPKTRCRWCCEAHRPTTTAEGTENQGKLCWRCGTAGYSSVAAPVTTVFVFRVLPKTNQTHDSPVRVLVGRMYLSTATFGPCPKTCCRWYCQAHPPTDEWTEKQEKLCCRCRTIVVVVCYEKLCWTSQVVDFSSSNYYPEFRGETQ